MFPPPRGLLIRALLQGSEILAKIRERTIRHWGDVSGGPFVVRVSGAPDQEGRGCWPLAVLFGLSSLAVLFLAQNRGLPSMTP